MDCPACKSADSLYGEITIVKSAPLAKRSGGIKVAGVAVTQLDLKESWEKKDGEARKVRGPITCHECFTRFQYLVETGELKEDE